mgnify:FL=1
MLRDSYVFKADPIERSPEDVRQLVRDCECAPISRSFDGAASGSAGGGSAGSVDPGTTGGSLDPPLDPFHEGFVDDGSGIGETGLDPVIEPEPEEECAYDSYVHCGTTGLTSTVPTCYIKVQPEGIANPNVIFVQTFGESGVCLSKSSQVACSSGAQGYILAPDEYYGIGDDCDNLQQCQNTPIGADYYRLDLCGNSPGGVNALPRSILVPVSYITGATTNLTYLYGDWCYHMGAHNIVSAPVASSETIPALADLTVQANCDTQSCTCCEVAANNLAVAILALKNRIQFVNSGLIPDIIGHGGTGAANTAGWNDTTYILNITPIGYEGTCAVIYAFYLTFIAEIEYWIDTLYASGVWLNTVTHPDADITDAGATLTYWGAADYTHQTLPLASDPNFCVLFTANVAAIQLAIQRLQAVTVAASIVNLSGRGIQADYPSTSPCSDARSCCTANANQAFPADGIVASYFYNSLCAQTSIVNTGTGSVIRKVYQVENPGFWSARAINHRGKIQSDLSAYITGTAQIYVMVGCSGVNVTFGQPMPTNASGKDKWGIFSGGILAVGQISTSGYLTGSNVVPVDEVQSDCLAYTDPVCAGAGASAGTGWDSSNQIVVLDGNFF